MNKFDKIIGYDAVKIEIERICDIVKNEKKYKTLGVNIPKGLLLYGAPGVGKTLFATCFIDECERKSFVCRKSLPDDEFIKYIKETFDKAKMKAPSIILLDDLDKFANEDEDHKNALEYVTIQSCIDEIKNDDVFVLATANELHLIPDSLLRAGRFDVRILINTPKGKDAEMIIKHYLETKKSVDSFDVKDLSRILNGRSCAELETIINQAGIYAGFMNKSHIEFEDIIRASIRVVYDAVETIQNESLEDNEMVAYHEAGHAVISEIVEPCSVTMISVGGFEGNIGGFTSFFRESNYFESIKLMKNRILCLLGGKCAIEVKYGTTDVGCATDIKRAIGIIERIMTQYAGNGFDKCTPRRTKSSNIFEYFQDRVIADELERYYQLTREILINNRVFLDELAKEIKQKKILVAKDIKQIKERILHNRNNEFIV